MEVVFGVLTPRSRLGQVRRRESAKSVKPLGDPTMRSWNWIMGSSQIGKGSGRSRREHELRALRGAQADTAKQLAHVEPSATHGRVRVLSAWSPSGSSRLTSRDGQRFEEPHRRKSDAVPPERSWTQHGKKPAMPHKKAPAEAGAP